MKVVANIILLNSVPKNERNMIPNDKLMDPHLSEEQTYFNFFKSTGYLYTESYE